jgi:hypothetical protein
MEFTSALSVALGVAAIVFCVAAAVLIFASKR